MHFGYIIIDCQLNNNNQPWRESGATARWLASISEGQFGFLAFVEIGLRCYLTSVLFPKCSKLRVYELSLNRNIFVAISIYFQDWKRWANLLVSQVEFAMISFNADRPGPPPTGHLFSSFMVMKQLQFILLDRSGDLVREWTKAFGERVPETIRQRFTMVTSKSSRLSDLEEKYKKFDCIVSPANSYGLLDGGCVRFIS